jgi:hypothetical protein
MQPKDQAEQSHFVAQHEYSCFSMSVLKFKMLSLQLELCKRAVAYEPIKDLYKTALTAYKHQKSQISQPLAAAIEPKSKLFVESIASFEMTRDAYIQGLFNHIELVFSQYMQIRQLMKENRAPANKQRQNELQNTFRNFRMANSINGDQIPHYLKDIFDLFIETHNSKQFLKKYELVSDMQRRSIRLGLLKACAICGPDSEFSDVQVTSKFLDLAAI